MPEGDFEGGVSWLRGFRRREGAGWVFARGALVAAFEVVQECADGYDSAKQVQDRVCN